MVRVLPAQTRWIASDFCCSSFCGGLWAAFEAVDEMGGNLPASSAGNTGNILLLSLFWGGKKKKSPEVDFSHVCFCAYTECVYWCMNLSWKSEEDHSCEREKTTSCCVPWNSWMKNEFTSDFYTLLQLHKDAHKKRGCYCNILLFESTVCLFHKMNTNEHHNTNYD